MEQPRPTRQSNESAVVCSICLDDILEWPARSTAKLQCGHRFHLDCIGSAFNMRGAMECPNCRRVENGQWLYGRQSQRQRQPQRQPRPRPRSRPQPRPRAPPPPPPPPPPPQPHDNNFEEMIAEEAHLSPHPDALHREPFAEPVRAPPAIEEFAARLPVDYDMRMENVLNEFAAPRPAPPAAAGMLHGGFRRYAPAAIHPTFNQRPFVAPHAVPHNPGGSGARFAAAVEIPPFGPSGLRPYPRQQVQNPGAIDFRPQIEYRFPILPPDN